MTPPTQDLFALLLAEVRSSDPDEHARLESQIRTIWSLYADKVYGGPMLRYWYTKRHLVQMLMGSAWEYVSFTEAGVSESGGQAHTNLKSLFGDIQTEIDKIEAIARGGRGGAIGVMSKTAPIMPSVGQPDANSRVYRGDPLYPPRRRG